MKLDNLGPVVIGIVIVVRVLVVSVVGVGVGVGASVVAGVAGAVIGVVGVGGVARVGVASVALVFGHSVLVRERCEDGCKIWEMAGGNPDCHLQFIG
jgi:hypothetical protein